MEGSEDEKKYNKYVSKLSPRQQNAEVTLGDVKKKAHELNNAEMEEALDNHDDPKDPTSLTQAALMVLASSREFYKNVKGGGGKRLAINPWVYKDGTAVEGVTPTERIFSNLRMYLTDPENGEFGREYVVYVTICFSPLIFIDNLIKQQHQVVVIRQDFQG